MQDQPESSIGSSAKTDREQEKAETRQPEQRTAAKQDQPTHRAGDYLFELAAKVLAYIRDNSSNAFPAELLERSDVLCQACADARYEGPSFPPPLTKELLDKTYLQQPLAYLVNYVPSKWLLEQEAGVIQRARIVHGRIDRDRSEWQAPGDVYEWAREVQLNGLCLSGGGIRSATFNLGILQGLAAQQKLNSFDYLSSVSGGGYIHGWLAGWLRREAGRTYKELPATRRTWEEAAREALKRVQEEMSPIPGTLKSGKPENLFAAHELRWLRRFSNYLTPAKGLFTLDTWTAGAIWLRNTFLNQLVLICAMLFLLLLPWLFSKAWQPENLCRPPRQTHKAPAPTRYTLGIKGPVEQDHTGLVSGATAVGAQTAFAISLVQDAPAINRRRSDIFKIDYCKALTEEITLIKPSDCIAKTAGNKSSKQAVMTAATTPPALACANVQLHALKWFEYGTFVLFIAGALSLGFLLWQEVAFTRKYDQVEQAPANAGKAVNNCTHPYRDEPQSRRDFGTPSRTCFIVVTLLSPAIPFCYALCCPGARPREVTLAAVGLLILSLCVAGGGGAFHLADLGRQLWCELRTKSRRGRPFDRTLTQFLLAILWVFVTSMGAAALGTVVFVLIAALIRSAAVEQWGAHLMLCAVPAVELTFGVPLLASLPFLTISILIGLVGRTFFDWLREVLGRLLAWTLLISLGWFTFFAIALLSPGLFLDAARGTGLKVSAVAAWLATTIAAVMSGKSPKTDGSAPTGKGLGSVLNAELLATIGPYVYILGLLVVLSSLVQLWVDVEGAVVRTGIAMGVSLGATLLLGWRLDANALSMFPFYRNRLTRCYLGASNRNRDPNPLTGFDDRDTRGLQIRCLSPDQGYPGPFPIFCATLNLTTGKELAYQERKGASFAFTPLYSGYAVSWTGGDIGTQFNGFVQTDSYAAPQGGLSIASAIAISGAAVSPNWGYHTKPATAFLLTMFNARLGRWLPNPRRMPIAGRKMETQNLPSPTPHGDALLHELFGQTDDSNKFIYLTDGGHFDNMGLYELVRRRCYDIVICDAEEDGSYSFEGIGMAIRKCRIDFGAEIDIDLSQLRTVAKTRFSSAHVAQGSIRYPETSAGKQGRVFYIKASLVAFPAKGAGAATAGDLPNVPGDVQNYALQHDNFPHDSTVNQWFTESQFESYRRLGQSVMEAIVQWPSKLF